MQQSIPWEAKHFSAIQEIHRTLRNLKIYYYIQTFMQPDPIQSHLNPVHAPLSTSWNSIKIILLSHKIWVYLVVSFP